VYASAIIGPIQKKHQGTGALAISMRLMARSDGARRTLETQYDVRRQMSPSRSKIIARPRSLMHLAALSNIFWLPRPLAARLATLTTYAAPDAGSNSKLCDFLQKYRSPSLPLVRLSDPPAMVEFGRFGILANGRPITLGGRAFDVLMALTEASRAVVSKEERLGRVWLIEDRTRATSGRRFPLSQN
jgi:hypothetical protein